MQKNKEQKEIELIKCNLQNEKDINNLVDKVITKYKKIDIIGKNSNIVINDEFEIVSDNSEVVLSFSYITLSFVKVFK